jgi:hypothetical protein
MATTTEPANEANATQRYRKSFPVLTARIRPNPNGVAMQMIASAPIHRFRGDGMPRVVNLLFPDQC